MMMITSRKQGDPILAGKIHASKTEFTKAGISGKFLIVKSHYQVFFILVGIQTGARKFYYLSMELVPDWAPNIHPMIVHFPLAILSLAVLSNFFETVLAQEWISKTRLWLYVLGRISALAAVLSGRYSEPTI